MRTLAKELVRVIRVRFAGIFSRVELDNAPIDPSKVPFYDEIYLMAAVLDPSFGLMWLQDVAEQYRDQLMQRLQGRL